MKKSILVTTIISVVFAACKSGEKTTSTVPTAALDCTAKTVTYTADIKPIMEKNCTRCHNTNEKAGYNFKSLEFVKKAAVSGHLLGTIKHAKGFDKMPRMAPKLDQALIDQIECWINNGMPE